ncbi:MAG: flagellar assembly peptidoglycan hydrolase FlgJ [Pseudomonadales bacterium]|nr:flagellar assembly peptidoglycan hydrolase FlgJ [Pseudomonadales bacterium]
MLDASSTLKQAQVYTDLNGLAKLKSAAKDNDPDAIEAVAAQFEALFMHLMLKSMREANAVFAEGNYMNSSSVDTYQQMLDQQLSVTLSEGKGMGLKDILVKQLTNNMSSAAPIDTKAQNNKQSDFNLYKNSNKDAENKNSVAAENLKSADNRVRADVLNKDVASDLALTKPFSDNTDNVKFSNKPVEIEKTKFSKMLTASDISKNPHSFMQNLLPLAEEAADEMGVDPKILIAQAALETGWGKHLINKPNGSSSFNLFNIKAGPHWQGETVTKDVVEYRGGISMQQQSQFRAYNSFDESFKDYVNFIKENPRYSQALEQSHSPEKYVQELHRAGYATDPAYSKKVTHVYHRMEAMQGT